MTTPVALSIPINPWINIDLAKAQAWDQLTLEDQLWLGNADPTDTVLLRRAPNRGIPAARASVPAVGASPSAVLSDLVVQQNPEGDWAVFDIQTGLPVISGLPTRELAEAELARILREAQGFAGGGVTVTPVTDVRNRQAQNDAANAERATLETARAQAALSERRRQANQGDWRVKLKLAPTADYLYKAPADSLGILQPLAVSDGVIFPYTPKIDLSYRAMYDITGLTHTNYNNYFYKNSMLDPVNITATFTAQDTEEANYLLAVIHFFRSVTKMFYGQDAQRGAPPPLVYFTGLGEYQFSEHPCLVHQFNYSLPSDVDYIRARSVMDPGTDLQIRRDRKRLPSNSIDFSIERLKTIINGPQKGAVINRPGPPTLGTNSPTYVPTRIDISLILYPIQSRKQVSNEFSLKQYANGDLLRGGFW